MQGKLGEGLTNDMDSISSDLHSVKQVLSRDPGTKHRVEVLTLVSGSAFLMQHYPWAFKDTESILAFSLLLNYSGFIIASKFALILFKMTSAQHPKDKIDIFL